MIGLDSAAIIDLINGCESLIKLLANLDEPIGLNRVNYFEVMLGVDAQDENFNEEIYLYDNLFNRSTLFELDENSCKKSSEIFWKLRKSGIAIEDFDCAIAGIYLSHGVNKIITKNVKHFENIKGLKVISY